MSTLELISLVNVVKYSLILIFFNNKIGNRRIDDKRIQFFLAGCHFLKQARRFLMKINFQLVEVPEDIMKKLLNNDQIRSLQLDLGNVVIFGKDGLLPKFANLCWLLVKTAEQSNAHRLVFAVQLPILNMENNCFASSQLINNLFLKRHTTKSSIISVFPEATVGQSGVVFCACSMKLALLNSSQTSNEEINEKLKQFFSFPRYVQINDVVQVDNQFSFVVKSVEAAAERHKNNLGFLVDTSSSVYQQSSNLPMFKIFYNVKMKSNMENVKLESFQDIFNAITSLQPPGLKEYCTWFTKVIAPHLFQVKEGLCELGQGSNLSSYPTFLIGGRCGSGKRTIVKTVAASLGLYFIEVSCLTFLGESSKATEVRIRNVFRNAQQSTPAILYLTNVDVIGKSRDVNTPDNRSIRFFVSEIIRISAGSSLAPLFVVGSCEDYEKCSPDVYSVLLHKTCISELTDASRKGLLDWILGEKNLFIDGCSLDSVIRKLNGFHFADLNTLIAVAVKLASISSTDSSFCLSSILMDRAIEIVRQWQTRSMNAPTIPEVKWEDIGGLQHIINELLATIQLPLRFPELIQNGLKRSGIMLYGPPGTGKTLLAKAVATECNLHFLSVKGPELLNMYVGQSEENVRNVFQAARNASPCLIFFDELDSLAPNRGASGDSGGVMDRVVAQLLAELDGINKSSVVFVIGATNRPDLVDQALLRPGRFDKLLFLGVNDSKEYQLSVLKAVTRKFKLDPRVNLEDIVQQLPSNLTGADLSSLASNAMLNCFSRKILLIKEGHLPSDDDHSLLSADFEQAAKSLVPSVSVEDLNSYKELERKINQRTYF